MSENKRFVLGKEPFIRKADHRENTTTMMRDFMIALIPLIIFAWVKNGLIPYLDGHTNFYGLLYPLLLILIGGVSAWVFEFLWYKLILKSENTMEKLSTSYPVIPGVLLAMIVPIATPLWLIPIGVFFATVVAKLLFGGFGHNVFNPALVGYLFLTYAYGGVLIEANNAISAVGNFNAKEVVDAISSATPLTVFAKDGVGSVNQILESYSLWDLFVGMRPGALAETSALLCLLSLVYLLIRKTINWRIPVIYLGTVFSLTYIIGAFNGYAGTLDYALFGILNGGLMFGAVFMATEPVTSPRNPNGKVIYAFALGVLTILFRFASTAAEGVATSILIMNMFTPLIERFAAKARVEPKKRKVVLSYVLIGLLFSGIGVFAISKNVEKPSAVAEIEILRKEQDFETLNFLYTFSVNDEEVLVEVKHNYKVASIKNSDYNDYKTQFEELLSKNKMNLYILTASETEEEIILSISTKGFANALVANLVFNNDFELIGYDVDTKNESYGHDQNLSGEKAWSGEHPDEVMPERIIQGQDNLDEVESITGATRTVDALINAARLGFEYIDYLENITELKLVGLNQDYESFNFLYYFRDSKGKHKVEANQEGTLITAVEDDIKAEVEDLVKDNLPTTYLLDHDINTNTIRVQTKGYAVNITAEVTYDPATYKITGYLSDSSDETYDNPYNSNNWNNEEPDEVLPSKIIDGQEDLSEVETIAGATITSNALIKAAEIALDYLAYLGGNNE